jgi:hypothetical protein
MAAPRPFRSRPIAAARPRRDAIARAAVEARLAACANILGPHHLDLSLAGPDRDEPEWIVHLRPSTRAFSRPRSPDRPAPTPTILPCILVLPSKAAKHAMSTGSWRCRRGVPVIHIIGDIEVAQWPVEFMNASRCAARSNRSSRGFQRALFSGITSLIESRGLAEVQWALSSSSREGRLWEI